MNTKRKAVLSSPAHSAWCCWHSIKFVGLESKYSRNASSATSPTWPFLGASNTCNFTTLFLLAFYEYKKKSCSLFARSFSLMLLTFDQVCRAWIEVFAKCKQRNIAHMLVLSHHKKHAILPLCFYSLFMNTKRKAVLSSPAHSAWCWWHSIKFVGLESKYSRNASSATSPTWPFLFFWGEYWARRPKLLIWKV
jgi:hypothetical protein